MILSNELSSYDQIEIIIDIWKIKTNIINQNHLKKTIASLKQCYYQEYLTLSEKGDLQRVNKEFYNKIKTGGNPTPFIDDANIRLFLMIKSMIAQGNSKNYVKLHVSKLS